MNAEGTCPICKIPLTVNSDHNHVEFCSKCRREFYPTEPKEGNERLEYSDLETVSGNEGGEWGEGPALLCSEDDNRFFGKEFLKKKRKDNESYLYQHFGDHVTIETKEYLPR